jgi:hypothetical protein
VTTGSLIATPTGLSPWGRLGGDSNHSHTARAPCCYENTEGDTWLRCGAKMNADQFANYMAGFQGAAYDSYYFWSTGLLFAQFNVKLPGVLYHLDGRTKAKNDPYDRTGSPMINAKKRMAGVLTRTAVPAAAATIDLPVTDWVMKTALSIFAALVVGGILLFVHIENSPPSESSIIANFRAHRSTYERLRLYLQVDEQLNRLASWGVVMKGSPVPHKPPTEGFSQERFNEYVTLLNELNAIGASRTHGPHPELCILLWASGWAADTRHISVCWLDEIPSTHVSSIDDFKRDADRPEARHQFIYRRIESNWYLEAD